MDNYFTEITSKIVCFTKGTDLEISKIKNKCVCHSDYFGIDCGIPGVIWKTEKNEKHLPTKIRRRDYTRRLIYGLPLNHEFDLFETRMDMQAPVVDVFVLHESNYTNSGNVKEPSFLNKFREGWLKKYHSKFLYIFQDFFPKQGLTDGKIADDYMRRHLGQTAFQKRLKGVEDDDLFVYNDGDELIRPEILTFLKIYEGFTDPVGFKYRWAIFGFFWTVKFGSKLYKYINFESAAMTVGFFRDFYDYDASLVRSGAFDEDNKKNQELKSIYKDNGKRIELFKCSEDAGWHCSYCFDPEGIRKKLLDAPLSDWPRWGDDPTKSSVEYIKTLIKNGQNFDGKFLRGAPQNMLTESQDPEFAPKYMLNHREKFKYLLENLYV